MAGSPRNSGYPERVRVLVVVDLSGEDARGVASLVEAGFEAVGSLVEKVDLSGLTSLALVGPKRRQQVEEAFAGKDLVVVALGRMTFADAGGPMLRQVATWAEGAVVPVIVVADQCQISTRELRTIGVEAGYSVTSHAEATRVAQTWAPAMNQSG